MGFDAGHRGFCLELLATHNGIEGKAAENTLDGLLDSDYEIYPKAELNLPGLKAVLELRADMGYMKQPLPPVDKYLDLSYYNRAVEKF